MLLSNSEGKAKYPVMPNTGYLTCVAIWILDVCYQEVMPSQQEVNQVIKELRNIYRYEYSLCRESRCSRKKASNARHLASSILSSPLNEEGEQNPLEQIIVEFA